MQQELDFERLMVNCNFSASFTCTLSPDSSSVLYVVWFLSSIWLTSCKESKNWIQREDIKRYLFNTTYYYIILIRCCSHQHEQLFPISLSVHLPAHLLMNPQCSMQTAFCSSEGQNTKKMTNGIQEDTVDRVDIHSNPTQLPLKYSCPVPSHVFFPHQSTVHTSYKLATTQQGSHS